MTYDRLILVLRYCLPDRSIDRALCQAANKPLWVEQIRKLGRES